MQNAVGQRRRFTNAMATRATRLNLPEDYQWKVLGWLADDLVKARLLTESEYQIVKAVVRRRDYALYDQLSEEWSLQSMASTLGYEPLEKSKARYQVGQLLKKFQDSSADDRRRDAALKKFVLCERRCQQYNRSSYIDFLYADVNSWVGRVRNHIIDFFEDLLGEVPSPSQWSERSRHGPGASLGMRDGQTSSYFKYCFWPYKCTTAALGLARQVISCDPRWLGALEDSYRSRFNIPTWQILDWPRFWDTVLDPCDENRIAFVPKSAKTDRSIAIEPTLNIFLQQGIDNVIRTRLRRWGVDLDDQKKNVRLARLGSLMDDYDSESYVTIDLEGASDSLSLKFLQIVLPDDWYELLLKLRCPRGQLGGRAYRYDKISSMGNAYTFALESAVFTAIIVAVIRATGSRVSEEDFAVYGDDLIVRRKYAYQLFEALRLAGFVVNSSKTFLFGNVRESCGADWVFGDPVRPVYLRRTPRDVMDLWSDLNRLHRHYSLNGLDVKESKLIARMELWIPESFRSFVGPCDDENFDGYRHASEPPHEYALRIIQEMSVSSLFTLRRLVRTPVPMRAEEFLFRKLMHDLRQFEYHPYEIESGSGSRFVVTNRKHVTMSISYSSASKWRNGYKQLTG